MLSDIDSLSLVLSEIDVDSESKNPGPDSLGLFLKQPKYTATAAPAITTAVTMAIIIFFKTFLLFQCKFFFIIHYQINHVNQFHFA